MTTYSKQFLSASTDGRAVGIAATSSPGTTVHTAHATQKDELTLYVTNNSSDYLVVTIQFGGTSTSDNIIVKLAPQQGDVRVVSGRLLSNSSVVRAYAAVANVAAIAGYVNRIG